MDTNKYISRLIHELVDLSMRTARLESFVSSEKFTSLEEGSQSLLKRQNEAMRTYMGILQQRIKHEFELLQAKVDAVEANSDEANAAARNAAWNRAQESKRAMAKVESELGYA